MQKSTKEFDKSTFTIATVTISEDHYRALMNRHNFLCSLEEAGVDNWEGYEEAQNLYEEKEKY